MSINVLVMRFNANELGYRNGIPGQAGPFCLIKKEALDIEGFNPQADSIPIYFDGEYKGDVTYKQPESKSERRLSLSKLKDSFTSIQPGKVVCLYIFSDGTNPEGINIEPVTDNSVYVSLLEKYGNQYTDNKTRQKIRNYLVTAVQTGSNEKVKDVNEEFLPLPKPFLLLAGISGTGKTRFVREQAEKHDDENNFCLVPVRPDWHEPSDLLGYVSRIGSRPEYVPTKLLLFIIDAWRAVMLEDCSGFDMSAHPYWLCLDEMNLAPVEQYFADYLSVLESRKFLDGKYSCDSLIDKSCLEIDGVQSDLGLDKEPALFGFFLKYGIPLPPNLIVAGTVNMDETTHGFSRKVIDRAISIDFGEFFPNDYSKFFGGQAKPKTLTYGTKTKVEKDSLKCKADIDGSKSIDFLDSINNVLRDTPFELAYRALNEILLFVATFSPDTDEKLQAVWDDFLMTKVLPRIDGDEDKLRVFKDDEQSGLLDELEEVLSQKLNLIWGDEKKRIDLLQNEADGSEINDVLCRSRKKIRWMRNRLDVNTFTSYWP